VDSAVDSAGEFIGAPHASGGTGVIWSFNLLPLGSLKQVGCGSQMCIYARICLTFWHFPVHHNDPAEFI
jgi:hypothetical protein